MKTLFNERIFYDLLNLLWISLLRFFTSFHDNKMWKKLQNQPTLVKWKFWNLQMGNVEFVSWISEIIFEYELNVCLVDLKCDGVLSNEWQNQIFRKS